MKSRIAMAKAAFNKKKSLLTTKLDFNWREKLVKCYICWSIALYGAEMWTLHEVDWKYLESFEMWCWRRVRLAGPIVWEIKKCYIESGRRGMSYIQ
jgi:hypothetical protein